MKLSAKRIFGAVLAAVVGITGMTYLLVTHYLQLGQQQDSAYATTYYQSDEK
ncbi:hypothetical protein [Lacticaseibacillus saniviri]|nr:hypothetical protein [Lacticaseibacillus saniviri]MCG4281027.1 hypothetical protein [Lacticaseibacillus saniviri]